MSIYNENNLMHFFHFSNLNEAMKEAMANVRNLEKLPKVLKPTITRQSKIIKNKIYAKEFSSMEV